MTTRKTQTEVLRQFETTHGDKYDYTQVEYTNANTKVTIICKTHGPFEQQPRAHLAGQGCPQCTQSPNWSAGPNTIQNFIERAKSVHGDKYDYSKCQYLGSMKHIEIICKHHGLFQQLANSHLNGRGCPECAGNKKKTTDQFVHEAHQIHGSTYNYSRARYKNATTKIEIICKKHGPFWQKPSAHIVLKNGCPKCSIEHIGQSLTKTTDDFITKARLVHGSKYDYTNVAYTNDKIKVSIKCVQHGEFLQRPNDHTNGYGCPQCAGNQLKTTKQFIAEAQKVHKNIYDYTKTKYVNSKNSLTIVCSKHGPFRIIPYQHLLGRGCKVCNTSPGQREIYQFIASHVKATINDRQTIGPLELDIYIKDLKLAIEYHGSWWHSYDHIESTEERMRHSLKCNACLSKGIKLLQVYDFEWKEKQQIVKSMLQNRLNKTIAIFARKCELIEANQQSKQFFNSNHLQGHRPARVCYGLVYNDQIVCAMSFTQTKNQNQWEIMRFASLLGHHIPGGASKLLSKFISDHQPISIMTFCDRRYSNGTGYTRLGFKMLYVTKPNYVYLKCNYPTIVRKSRQSCQKHKLKQFLPNFDENLTETENMFNNGYRRLWDAGHYKFEMKIN